MYHLLNSKKRLFWNNRLSSERWEVQEAAKSLGVANNLLYRWKEQQKQLSTGKRLAEEERSEFQRLRKENKELRMEKEILKKASAFFVKEMK